LCTLTDPAPQTSDVLSNNDVEAPLLDQLVAAYTGSTGSKKSLAVYAAAETITVDTPPRNLTVFEASKLCQMALSEIYTLEKAKKNPTTLTAVLILVLWGFWGWFIAAGRTQAGDQGGCGGGLAKASVCMSSSHSEKIRKLVIAAMLLKNCALELTFDLADCHNASP
jgi:hypothetical protein